MKYSLALHPLQYAITMRGLKLLRVGGRLVYSTCSLNPIEDEAVVMALVRRCRGAVRIVDVRAMYPALKRMPGLFTWQVCDQENNVYPNFTAIPEEQKRLYRETMFAPQEAAEAQAAHLEWAMRFLPHQQDTGGFFVCVLEKVAEIPRAEKEEEEEAKEEEAKEENKEEKEEEEKEEEEKEEEIGSEEEANGDLVGIVKEEQR